MLIIAVAVLLVLSAITLILGFVTDTLGFIDASIVCIVLALFALLRYSRARSGSSRWGKWPPRW